MKYQAKPFALKLINPFGISRGTKTESPLVIVKIGQGYGESAPYKLYGETIESVINNLSILDSMPEFDYSMYRGQIQKIYQLLPQAHSTKTAIDLAIWDNVGKQFGLPVYKLLGLNPANCPLSSFTIGIADLDKMIEKIVEAKHYPIIKIKLGFDGDMEYLTELRKHYDGKIRIDANAAWTAEQAIEKVKIMADLDIEFVEQPLAKNDFEGSALLFEKSPLPIILDESILTSRDVQAWYPVCHGINIKLMKCGGILEALTMIELARTYDRSIMLGGMIESSIGVSAAAQIAPLVDYIDLDANSLISNDPFSGYKMDDAGSFHFSDVPGLGITPNPDFTMEDVS